VRHWIVRSLTEESESSSFYFRQSNTARARHRAGVFIYLHVRLILMVHKKSLAATHHGVGVSWTMKAIQWPSRWEGYGELSSPKQSSKPQL